MTYSFFIDRFELVKLFSRKTIFEVCGGVSINLTAVWFGFVIISPGFFGLPIEKYISVLTPNIVFGILGLLISFWFVEKRNKL